ncbi:MAG: DUF2779 domain-containing protein [bacterium]|nr:DUF2779 domain-containing protein [bacterium]
MRKTKTTTMSEVITKSMYLAALQCPKYYWYRFHHPEWIPDPGARLQAALENGKRLGLLARTLFPDGIDLSDVLEMETAVEQTVKALASRKPIFEAAVRWNDCAVRCDILQPVHLDEWEIIEVKSSTSVKKTHLHDLAFQRFVCENAKLKIRNCHVLHLNGEYERIGELDVPALFVQSDVTRDVFDMMARIEPNLQWMRTIPESKEEPKIAIGNHCGIPRPCPLQEHCWSFLPKDNVFTLTRIRSEKAHQWVKEGITSLYDLPEKVKLGKTQRIQFESLLNSEPHIEIEELSKFLQKLKYPIHYLDFETFGPPIPEFEGTKPHQSIPFQFSLHHQPAFGAPLAHVSYLAEGGSDPRPEILQRLKSELGTTGSIVAYNAKFEMNVLHETAKQFSEYRDWVETLKPRFVDLLKPFQSYHYYHPQQRGSASLKAVLPAMTGRSYQELPIGNGELASIEYYRTHFSPVSPEERLRIRKELVEYCGLDTEAMVLLVDAIENLCETKDCKAH